MVIGDTWVFVHNPKTGGTSIRKALEPFGERKKDHNNLWPNQDAFKPDRVVVVRNPFDRLVSGYKFHQKNPVDEHNVSFEEWLTSDIPWMVGATDFKRTPQIYWAYLCNRVLRFENLSFEFEQTMAELKIPAQLEVHNKSEIQDDYQNYYNAKLVEIVKDRFGPDLREFEYEFGK